MNGDGHVRRRLLLRLMRREEVRDGHTQGHGLSEGDLASWPLPQAPSSFPVCSRAWQTLFRTRGCSLCWPSSSLRDRFRTLTGRDTLHECAPPPSTPRTSHASLAPCPPGLKPVLLFTLSAAPPHVTFTVGAPRTGYRVTSGIP